MINFSWEGDKQLKETLDYVGSRIDKKISWGLNGLAFQANREVKDKLPQWLDLKRGANFIKNSFVYDKSTPENLSVTLGALDRLHLAPLLEQGGTRKPLNRAIGIPVGEKPIAKSIKAAYTKGAFSASIGGVEGLWLRVKKKKISTLNLLFAWEPQTTYKGKNIEFFDTVENYFHKNYEGMVSKSIDELVDHFSKK